MGKNVYWKKVEEKFKSYEISKDKVYMYQIRIESITAKQNRVKPTNCSSEISSGSNTSNKENLTELVSHKVHLEKLIEYEQGWISEFERSLKFLENKYPQEYIMFKIRHLEHQTLDYICTKLRWASKNTVIGRLQEMEKTFLSLLSYLDL